VFNIQSVPTIIVDGKFITASDRFGGHANVPMAIDARVGLGRDVRGKGCARVPSRHGPPGCRGRHPLMQPRNADASA
jgi:hypothetical protein